MEEGTGALIRHFWPQRTRTYSKWLKRKEELIGRRWDFSEHKGKQPSWVSWELGIRKLSERKTTLSTFPSCIVSTSSPLFPEPAASAHSFCSRPQFYIMALGPGITINGPWCLCRHHSVAQERESTWLRFCSIWSGSCLSLTFGESHGPLTQVSPPGSIGCGQR